MRCIGVNILLAQQADQEFLQTLQNYSMHDMGKTVNELHAMRKLHEQTQPKQTAPALHVIRAGKGLRASWKKCRSWWLAVLVCKVGLWSTLMLLKQLRFCNYVSRLDIRDCFEQLSLCSLYTGKGCEALVKRDILTKPNKLEPRSINIFIGYPKETMRYSFYYPPENKVLVARNTEILENSLITQEASGSLEDLEIIQEEDTLPFYSPLRTRIAPIVFFRMCLYIDAEEHELRDLGEPANYKAALLDPESDK
ncbi:hypothetical protein Tco_0140634 [Tanacetum coccineum]